MNLFHETVARKRNRSHRISSISSQFEQFMGLWPVSAFGGGGRKARQLPPIRTPGSTAVGSSVHRAELHICPHGPIWRRNPGKSWGAQNSPINLLTVQLQHRCSLHIYLRHVVGADVVRSRIAALYCFRCIRCPGAGGAFAGACARRGCRRYAG